MRIRARSTLEPADTGCDLCHRRLHDTELLSLAVRELVHRRLGNVKARLRMVDGKDVNGVVLVLQLPACAAVGRVPAYESVS